MRRRKLVRAGAVLTGLGAVCVAGLGSVGAGIASADPVGAPICSSAGKALAGDHRGNLVVRGNAYVADGATLRVRGNLVVARGACLDAFSLGTVHVRRNVLVGHGATLALGCAPGANGPPPMAPCNFTTTDDTVGGNLLALRPQTMYLTAVTVGRNVVSVGGGPGTQSVGTSFAVKDMKIRGDLVLYGWKGGWIGALRNQVGRNLLFSRNAGSRPGDSGAPDSSEVDGNTVGRNLVCFRNQPAAQFGDAPPPHANTVAGRAIGECKGLTAS